MEQFTFSCKKAFIGSAATDDYTQPSATSLNRQPLKNSQPIHFTNGDSIKVS